MNLSEVVISIKQLPLIEFKDLIFDSDDIRTCLSAIKSQYKNHGRWLDYFLLHYQELWYELIKGDVGWYKPLGERTLNIYLHLKQTKLLSAVFQTIDINDFLYLIEREKFYQSLENLGLYGSATLKGKRKIYEETKFLSEKFSDVEKLTLIGNSKTYSPWNLLINESTTISKTPDNYEFRNKHRDFLKQIKRCDYLMYKSPLQVIYMKKEKLILGGDGKRASK